MQLTQHQKTKADTITQEMAKMPCKALLELVLAHIEGRPDMDADALMDFSNKCGRIAWREI